MTTDSDLPGECPKTGVPLSWACSEIEYAVCPREKDDPPFEDVLDTIEQSFETWQDIECDDDVISFDFPRNDDPQTCDRHENLMEYPEVDFSPNENLLIFVKNWREFEYDQGAFALTSVWHNTSTGEIVGIDMELNETIGDYGICDEKEGCGDIVDLRNVVTHEIGHILGMGHTSDSQAVMYAESEPGDLEKRTLKSDDVEGLCYIYSGEPLDDCGDRNFTSGFCAVAGNHNLGRPMQPWGYFIIVPFILWGLRRRITF